MKTRNYDMFGRIVGNRPVDVGNLRKIEKSISAHNMLSFNPILVNKNYKVIDGQHRLEAARKFELEVYYNVLDVDDDEALRIAIDLNNASKNWRLMNYVISHIELGRSDYEILKGFVETYQLPLTTCFDLLSGSTAGHRGNRAGEVIRNGTFKAKGVKQAMKLAEGISLTKPYVGKVYMDRNFLKAIHLAFGHVGINKMVKKLAESPLKVQRQLGWKEYLRNLEDIYNYRLYEKNKVRFF